MPEDAVQAQRSESDAPVDDTGAAANHATRGYDCVAVVSVDEQGFSLPESHIRIAARWIEQRTDADASRVLAELGLAGNYREVDGSKALLLTLTDAVRLAETSLPAEAHSEDARQLWQSLSGMAHGLNGVVEKRVRAMTVLHNRVRPMKNLTQSGRYSGPLCPPYRFGVAISRN